MLVLSGGQAETLFDLALPVEVMDLPADLACIDRLLDDPAVLAPIDAAWAVSARDFGRPTIPMDRLVRLMVIKARSGWGYETLVKEVSDSLHLRRFCRIALTEPVPDESTVRKLVRRLGPEVIEEIVMILIGSATQQGTPARFQVRAARIDSLLSSLTFATRPTSSSVKTRRRSSRVKRRRYVAWPQRSGTGPGRSPSGSAS